MKLVTRIYNDGTKVSVQWLEILDGKWPYGDIDEKIIIKNFNFYE